MILAKALILNLLVVAAATTPAAPKPAQAGTAFPWAYDWSKFPTAWFAANDTVWESAEQIAAIGKYSMAILGWQHLDNAANWTAVVYLQLTQAAIIKDAHPKMPVFVYCGFGFAFGLNSGTWAIMNDPVYKDFFLQSSDGPVFTQTNCQQGHTSPGATGGRCIGHFWNMANASARDYFVEKLVEPLATAPMIDGVFYDAFNYGYDIPEVHPWNKMTVNVPNCTFPDFGSGCDALVSGTIDVAVRTAKLLNSHNKVPMYANVGTFLEPSRQKIWMNETRLADALEGTQWMSYYESARAESMLDGCPEGKQTGSWCILGNMLQESKLGIPSGVHTYLKNNTENQLPHMAAFMLSRNDYWYYFGSTGWWDNSFHWDENWDKASSCGMAKGPSSAGPVYKRAFEHCEVTLDCTQNDFCRGDISFEADTSKVMMV